MFIIRCIGSAAPGVQHEPSDTLSPEQTLNVRALGVDLGMRRIGLALSDATGTLARPFKTLMVSPTDALDRLVQEIGLLAAEEDGLAVVVVGVPARLDGEATSETALARAMMDALRTRIGIPVLGEDERLTSREAEQRLALRERDWRKRKQQLDAASAAVLLQDYLDSRQRTPSA